MVQGMKAMKVMVTPILLHMMSFLN
jgi:hypothetical protein